MKSIIIKMINIIFVYIRIIWGKICIHLPVQNKTFFFESEDDFCDNSWALYQYLLKKKKYKFVWIVSNAHNFKNTEDTRFISWKSLYGLSAIYYYSVSGYIFYTHCMYRGYHKRKQQLVVDLEHGTGFKAGKNSTGNYCDYALVTGEFWIKPFSKYLGIPEEKLLPLGYPRLDLLLKNLSSGQENPLCRDKQFKKLVIWMPTFRASRVKELSEASMDNETGLPLVDNKKKLEILDWDLSNLGILLMIKVHHLQAEKAIFLNTFQSIIFINDKMLVQKGIQLYEMIGKTDALITDYSSISVDYLLADKPIGYILDDYDLYKKSRGFKFENITDYMPGEHIYTMNDYMAFLRSILDNCDKYKVDRERMISIMHASPKGGSCEKICSYFGI